MNISIERIAVAVPTVTWAVGALAEPGTAISNDLPMAPRSLYVQAVYKL